MKDLFQKFAQIQKNLHKEVHSTPEGLELGEERISSFAGMLRNHRYDQARIPEELANDCGFSSGPEMLVSNSMV